MSKKPATLLFLFKVVLTMRTLTAALGHFHQDSVTSVYPNIQETTVIDTWNTGASTEHSPSFEDIVNQKVDKSELCPKKNVLLYFTTGDLTFLRQCLRMRDVTGGISVRRASNGNTEDAPRAAPDMNYSGILLKKILQNINTGKFNILDHLSDKVKMIRHEADKKSGTRLSVNSALTSLSDMVRHQSDMRNRNRQHGFRQRLLNLG